MTTKRDSSGPAKLGGTLGVGRRLPLTPLFEQLRVRVRPRQHIVVLPRDSLYIKASWLLKVVTASSLTEGLAAAFASRFEMLITRGVARPAGSELKGCNMAGELRVCAELERTDAAFSAVCKASNFTDKSPTALPVPVRGPY
jgi:hypothetical protein